MNLQSWYNINKINTFVLQDKKGKFYKYIPDAVPGLDLYVIPSIAEATVFDTTKTVDRLLLKQLCLTNQKLLTKLILIEL